MAQKVLVVDDEQQIRDVLEKFFKGEGYEVVTSSNGEKALELVKRENPHVIILDIKMPGIDGIEVCRRLRAVGNCQSISIIVLSASVDELTRAAEAGADDCVKKPVDLPSLSVRVKSVLSVRDLTDAKERTMAYLGGTTKTSR